MFFVKFLESINSAIAGSQAPDSKERRGAVFQRMVMFIVAGSWIYGSDSSLVVVVELLARPSSDYASVLGARVCFSVCYCLMEIWNTKRVKHCSWFGVPGLVVDCRTVCSLGSDSYLFPLWTSPIGVSGTTLPQPVPSPGKKRRVPKIVYLLF